MSEEDRELTRLAALAAGEEVEWLPHEKVFYRKAYDWPREKGFFAPLHDDGEALRLAVKLDIGLRLNGDELTGIAHWHKNGRSNRVVGNYRTGNAAEARRLIVRAAATIAKATASPMGKE
jgi:hypothetical protein